MKSPIEGWVKFLGPPLPIHNTFIILYDPNYRPKFQNLAPLFYLVHVSIHQTWITLCITSQTCLLANSPRVWPGEFTDNSIESQHKKRLVLRFKISCFTLTNGKYGKQDLYALFQNSANCNIDRFNTSHIRFKIVRKEWKGFSTINTWVRGAAWILDAHSVRQ